MRRGYDLSGDIIVGLGEGHGRTRVPAKKCHIGIIGVKAPDNFPRKEAFCWGGAEEGDSAGLVFRLTGTRVCTNCRKSCDRKSNWAGEGG
eukprot:12864344-Ditylum_brightwellii.AAC.1